MALDRAEGVTLRATKAPAELVRLYQAAKPFLAELDLIFSAMESPASLGISFLPVLGDLRSVQECAQSCDRPFALQAAHVVDSLIAIISLVDPWRAASTRNQLAVSSEEMTALKVHVHYARRDLQSLLEAIEEEHRRWGWPLPSAI